MSEVIECTKDNPWNLVKSSRDRVCHHDTEEVGEQQDGWPGGDIIKRRCKNCGTTWLEELPQ